MKDKINQYTSQLKKKHSFAWSPQYEESFTTTLSLKRSREIAKMIIPLLDLLPLTHTKTGVRAISEERWNREYEYITFDYQNGKITINSKTVGKGFWDMGRNYKWVKGFIYAFQLMEKKE